MYKNPIVRFVHAGILVLALASCGGGLSTAGNGGSGVGGTGITRVSGNVVQVVASEQETSNREARGGLFVSLVRWISRGAIAQSTSLGGIRVSGGGQSTTTDTSGDFELLGVRPGDDFRLTFEAAGSRPIVLPVGEVSTGASVEIKDIVLDTLNGTAEAAEIRIQENPGNVNSIGADNGSCTQGNEANQGNPCDPGQGNQGQGNQGQGNQGQGNQGQGNQGQGNQGQGNQGQGNQGQGNQGQGNQQGQGNPGQSQ